MQSRRMAVKSDSLLKLKGVYETPGHLIRRAQQIGVAIFMDELAEHGITPVQFASLIAIRDNPGIDQKSLGRLIAIDRSTVANVLSGLEKKKLICRIVPAHNQRIKQLFTLAAGNELLANAQEAVLRVQDRILAPLTGDEAEIFLRLLNKIVVGNNNVSRAPLSSE
ncbi:MarR family winged helix-turn-helix transcriptional regulator [Pinisolibacter sp.]|uniref:MarR family winged helix-turn-helix transcriptional regulator n=1 Tax=Pinisolibacter sp. TaxID=2172024 RepID=UPI002FDDDA3A